jgi:hypothetical protein
VSQKFIDFVATFSLVNNLQNLLRLHSNSTIGMLQGMNEHGRDIFIRIWGKFFPCLVKVIVHLTSHLK